MTPMLLVAAWLLAGAPGDGKDRSCFAKCSEEIQACQDKCPPLPESADEGEDETDDKPKPNNKARQPTGPEACHTGCLKKSESCMKGCK